VSRRLCDHPVEGRPLRVALVLWSGQIGGAESVTGELARALAAHGAEPSVLFILDSEALGERLYGSGVPHAALGFRRGREVLRAPRRFARAVGGLGADVAILVEAGWFAAALRGGGHRAPIIGVEHGSRLQLHKLGLGQRLVRGSALALGMEACSALVGVSEYVTARIPKGLRKKPIVCIPNGVELERFSPRSNGAHCDEHTVIGCAARLIEGKGIEDAVRALAQPRLAQATLRVAGDGPHLEALQGLARSLGVDSRTEFLGTVLDMPSFWRRTDVAVAPSTTVVESFGMAAVEAMACGKPVVVTDNGGLAEVVVDEETGRVVPRGDVVALTAALADYIENPERRVREGAAGRRRCEKRYAIEGTAARYLELCADLLTSRRRS
jgi:glycosyltransferase involved in cell wall biosynthesis